MEGPIPPRSKPLSYDALKSVIKSMSVEKRQELHHHLPSLRATNSVLPYIIEVVRIEPISINIDWKEWYIIEHPRIWYRDDDDSNDDDSDNGDSNQTTISISYSQKSTPDFHVKESVDEVFEKIFNVYLKNGSTIQYFDFCHVPKFLCERDGSDGLKLNISTLIMDNGFDNFDAFIRFVNLDTLENIYLPFENKFNEHGELFGMLERPEIINCKNLDFFVTVPETPPINFITGLRNQNLVLNHSKFDVNELRNLIENWKTSDRPIGTSFCLWSYTLYEYNIKEMFDSLNLQDTFPIEIQRDSTDKPGIGMTIDDNRDLVVYHCQHLNGIMRYPALKMEVIASGSEKKNGDSEPDASA
ncbi:hypothetical protein GCK72_007914 [Caenorhabditis remanei]|uniref:F-box associated domain-containing protein n=1 Tax=Caenorhabditis remanei TaxID=31234 RepID=A0A6A5HMX6_CAERE|nr:hypothetical protein GCK72_007914 [Caenorhabditis remanei]KAF1767954.1 hypothetical protein GCK72_007914 [Caenorhabditis remanei]